MTYESLSIAFADVKNASVSEVGRIIGGKVQQNVESGIFKNACALRLSYAFNKAGNLIKSTDGAVSSGADGKWYLYRVADMEKYLKRITPEKDVLTGNQPSDFVEKKGIIVFKDCNWVDASGHVDLYNGGIVEGHDYSLGCNKVFLYIV